MSNEDCQYFVKCFLTWLRKQVNERNFSSDVVESIEVATQCLEAAYDIPSGSDSSIDGAEGGGSAFDNSAVYANVDLFEIFQNSCVTVPADRQERAEEIKNEGNRLMKENKFNEALFAYNKAISLDATKATFYCNRAAAYIRLSEFDKAISDCKLALVYNPQYGKAYGRMGIAYSNLRKYDEACDAYRKAIELEPNNEDYKKNLRIAENQIENLGQQLLNHITGNNPELRNAVMDMLSDPQVSMVSCQAASRVARELMNPFRSQLASFFERNPGNGQPFNLSGDDNTGSTTMPTDTPDQQQQQQQPPPSNSGSGDPTND